MEKFEAHYDQLSVSDGQICDLESSCQEESPFLPQDPLFEKRAPFLLQHTRSLIYYSGLLSFNLAIIIYVCFFRRNQCPFGVYGPDLVYTPARDAIAYETRIWDSSSVYFRNGSVNPERLNKGLGTPSEETDAAWSKLVQHQNIRLTRDELGEYRDKPGLVELADGSGYYASLSAYHSIHCIKRLHHIMHFEHYYPNKTEKEAMLIRHHAEHCLNILLQTVQCNPDLSILPMQWGASTRIPIGLDQGQHQCINWEKIDGWMKNRSINPYTPGLVVHPKLGEAYPDGQGDELGIALDHLLSEDLEHSENPRIE